MNTASNGCRWNLTLLLSLVCSVLLAATGQADVKQSAADGFVIVLREQSTCDATAAYEALVQRIDQWWDPDHTYSGTSENLSVDLNRMALLENLGDDGWVKHMDVSFARPGKEFRMLGGLGPLQEMGVHGALKFAFEASDEGTTITLTYSVSGASFNELDKLAAIVDQVLAGQLRRLAEHCNAR